MSKIIQSQDVTLADLKEKFNLQKSTDENFFSECWEMLPELTDLEKQYLERVKANYLSLVENSPLLNDYLTNINQICIHGGFIWAILAYTGQDSTWTPGK